MSADVLGRTTWVRVRRVIPVAQWLVMNKAIIDTDPPQKRPPELAL